MLTLIQIQPLRARLYRYESVALPFLYGLILLLISPIHSTFDEWGGVMQYFAGKEIFAGLGYGGWTAHFWPPLFSFLIGLMSFALLGFTAGKLISIGASVLLLIIAYDLALLLTGGRKIVGILTQVFVALAPEYIYESLRAHNHMLDALVFMAGVWLIIRSFEKPTVKWLAVAGFVCGLASLTRFTSYALFILPLTILICRFQFWKNVKLMLAFWGGFIIVSLPYWIYNVANSGVPVISWAYMDVCSAVYPGNPYTVFSLQALWWCSGQVNLHSLNSIILQYPSRYITNMVRNIPQLATSLIKLSGVLIPFTIPGAFQALVSVRSMRWFILLVALSACALLYIQVAIVDYIILSWTVVVVICGVMFMTAYLDRLIQRYQPLGRIKFRGIVIASLIAGSFIVAAMSVQSLKSEEESYGTLADLEQVTEALQKYDPNLSTKVIMAVDPARAYYTGAEYLETPADYDGSVEDLVAYKGLSDDVKAYAPKYPSSMTVSQMRADYLVYARVPDELPLWAPRDLSQYSFLLDPHSEKVPHNFRLVYQSQNVVVYGIDWSDTQTYSTAH